MLPPYLYHPLDGITYPKYKLLHFWTTKFFFQKKKALAFNLDRCCHLALCLWLILFQLVGQVGAAQGEPNSVFYFKVPCFDHKCKNIFFKFSLGGEWTWELLSIFIYFSLILLLSKCKIKPKCLPWTLQLKTQKFK